MSEPWVADENGRLIVDQPVGKAARLFGLPFVAVGLYLAWNVVAAMFETLTGGHPSEAVGFIAGWIIATVVAAAFLIPGWLLLTLRKRTIVDRARREVTDVRDFLVYRHQKTQPIGSKAEVRLEREVSSSNEPDTNSRQIYSVTLVPAAGREVIVWLADTEQNARDVGSKFASVVGVPVVDLLARPAPSEVDEDPAD